MLKKILGLYNSNEKLKNKVESTVLKAKETFNDSVSYLSSEEFKDKIEESSQTTKEILNNAKVATQVKVEKINDTYITSEITNTNWNYKAYTTLTDIADIIINSSNNATSKIVKSSAAKIGAVGTTAGIFSLATIAGTASTGTAIGTLSGAAFTNASLAWIGGSVLMGTVVISALSIVGGVAAGVGAKYLYQKYFTGDERKIEDLTNREGKIYSSILYLSTALKEQSNNQLNSTTAKAIYTDVLIPLEVELEEYSKEIDNTKINKDKYLKALTKFKALKNYSNDFIGKYPTFTIGVVSSVIAQLYSGYTNSFDENEELVLDAIRRSTNDLNESSSVEDIAEYIQQYSTSQLIGITSNIKGIYHEIIVTNNINETSLLYQAEMFEETNHAGADIKITNIITGESKEYQLKATDSMSYLEKHFEKYPDIETLVTEELAIKLDNVESSGVSNEEITAQVKEALDKLKDYEDSHIVNSIAIAATIALAKNIKVILKGNDLDASDKKQILEDITIATGTAGIFAMLASL